MEEVRPPCFGAAEHELLGYTDLRMTRIDPHMFLWRPAGVRSPLNGM